MIHTRQRAGVRRTALTSLAGAAALALALSGCASGSGGSPGPTTTTQTGGSVPGHDLQMEVGKLNFNPEKYCGDKPMKVGILTGAGSNPWGVAVRAILEKFDTFCPNISEIQYYDANLDVTKYNSTLNAWAAQGFNVVWANNGFFTTQSLPAFRAAQQAGVVIGSSDISLGEGVVPGTVTANVVSDLREVAGQYVKFFDGAKPEGTAKILLIGGTPGNATDPKMIQDMKDIIDETGADVEFLQDEPIVGNYDIATSAQAAASIIPKYSEIDGVVLTYAAAAPAVLRAFTNADRPYPAVAGTGSTSGALCEFTELRAQEPTLQMLTFDGTGNIPALALIKAIATYQGIDAPELGPTDADTMVRLVPSVDTLNGVEPSCNPDLPSEADASMALTPQELIAALG